MPKKKVAVTGSSGFIGEYLCQRLLDDGYEVVALGRTQPKASVELIHWDLKECLDSCALAGVDTVFHLAGKAHTHSQAWAEEEQYLRLNTAGTRKLLNACQQAGVRRFVFFSSVKATEVDGEQCHDESSNMSPRTNYGRSKLMAEQLVLEGGFVTEPVVLRLSMVYGGTDKGNLPLMMQAIAKGYFPPLPELHNRRSMVHVNDVVEAAVLVAEHERAVNQVFIVTDSHPYSTYDIYQWIRQTLGLQSQRWFVPLFVLKLIAKFGDAYDYIFEKRFVFDSVALDKLIGSACFSSEKIERELNFKPQYTLLKTLQEMKDYLKL